ncbi:MAG: HAD hydrolase-like protein [Gemmatimonadota bacterium]|nr:MAG: HAD hydrolase-like protein [Gemmatimonadota bacterium]
MRQFDLVVFDLGGTTIEDRGDVSKAFTAALKSHRIDVTDSELLGCRGRSKLDTVRFLVEKKSWGDTASSRRTVGRIYEAFREELKNRFQENGVSPIPDAEKVFSWLKGRKIKTAMTTGFDRHIADFILKKLSWQKNVFDATVCGSEVSQGRPAPFMIFRAMEACRTIDVHRVIKVGDTPVDIQAGTNAGVHTVAVLTGPHDENSLRKEKPAHIIPSIAELPDVLKGEGFL